MDKERAGSQTNRPLAQQIGCLAQVTDHVPAVQQKPDCA